jgi:hypothetical protein
MAVFAYSGDDSVINDDDVIYVRDGDIWRLQEDVFNTMVMGNAPVLISA